MFRWLPSKKSASPLFKEYIHCKRMRGSCLRFVHATLILIQAHTQLATSQPTFHSNKSLSLYAMLPLVNECPVCGVVFPPSRPREYPWIMAARGRCGGSERRRARGGDTRAGWLEGEDSVRTSQARHLQRAQGLIEVMLNGLRNGVS
jgi:hypothetical protein